MIILLWNLARFYILFWDFNVDGIFISRNDKRWSQEVWYEETEENMLLIQVLSNVYLMQRAKLYEVWSNWWSNQEKPDSKTAQPK